MKILNIDDKRLVPSFRELGHDVLTIGRHERGGGYDIPLDRPLYHAGLVRLLKERSFKPDLVLWLDSGYLPRVFGAEALDAVYITYFVDTYCNPWQVPYSGAADAALCAQRNAAELMAGDAHRVRWLPLFCDAHRDRDAGMERDIPVSFVGTVGHGQNRDRALFLDAFRRAHPLVAVSGDYVPVYNRSRIVLNQSAAGEINYRQFEAAACGAAVLAEETDQGLNELFTPGVDMLPCYPRGDAAAAARLAATALADPDGLARIARAGRDKVVGEHSSMARAREVVALARDLAERGAPAQRLGNLAAAHEAMCRSFRFIVADAGTLPPEHVAMYARLGEEYGRVWNVVGAARSRTCP